jgi:two-component system, OmpR family, alkaline phosphatase synthesis response regulator PhoP
MTKILIVDDETDILDFLSYNLKREGFEVYTATSGLKGLDLAKSVRPHLILLDLMMPEMDGVETCRRLRTQTEFDNTVIAFLTAQDSEVAQIQALDIGGDDYISKPIKPQVLVSRLKALLRRNKTDNATADDVIRIADMEINRTQFQILKGGERIDLPKKEFELLLLLTSRPGKVFTREEIYAKIWGNDIIVGDRTLDVHIRKLREKIGSDNIKTLKSIGYKFDF